MQIVYIVLTRDHCADWSIVGVYATEIRAHAYMKEQYDLQESTVPMGKRSREWDMEMWAVAS